MSNNLESKFFKDQARNDLLSFCVYTDKFYQVEKHHELIWDTLHKFLNWEIQNLIICMPPRSWKSRIMQEFIAYLYWIRPNTDILYTWHSLSLLRDFSRNIQDRISGLEYKSLFKSQIKAGNASVDSWKIDWWWVFSIYWVWGWITGKWWHILLVDDPYSWRQDAESETIRRTVSNWYWSTLLSRKQTDKTQQIIIMQRWREDDLVWEILEREWDKRTMLKVPALDEEWQSFRPSRFSKEYFEDIKSQNPLFFMSQYQQDPVNEWSWDFKREYFEYYEIQELDKLKDRLEIVTFLDPAISERQEADNTAIVTIGIDKASNYVYLLEVKKFKESPDIIIDEIFDTAKRYMNYWKSYRAWIEVVQYQKMLALEINKQMRIRDCFFVLEEVRPMWEKEARIKTTLQPRYASHTIIHPKQWANIWDYELELLKFPKWKHDDMIDACSWALNLTSVYSVKQVKPVKIDYSKYV